MKLVDDEERMVFSINRYKKTYQDSQEKAKTCSESIMPIGLTSQQNRTILKDKDIGHKKLRIKKPLSGKAVSWI